MTIDELLKRMGCKTEKEAKQAGLVNLWWSWYQGKVERFHNYTVYNGQKNIRLQKKSLNLAKQICENFADLIYNDNVNITLDTEEKTERLAKILSNINFKSQVNEAIEKAFATGTGALVLVKDGEKLNLNHVYSDDIYPITYANGVISECAFKTIILKNDKRYCYLSIHAKGLKGYVISNALYELGQDNVTLGEIVESWEYSTGSDSAWFCIIKPNCANNTSYYSPYGVSVFANAISELEAIDEAFNSLDMEVKNGKLKVLVASDYINMIPDSLNVTVPAFDSNDTVFHMLPKGMNDQPSIQIIAPQLRAEQFIRAINADLKVISSKLGLGSDFYAFDAETGIKTATEVISKNSQMFRRIKKHEILLEYSLKQIIGAICSASGITTEEITINFDDSIVQDKESERAQDLVDVNAGILNKWEYRMKWYAEDEATARKYIEENEVVTY